MAAMVREAISLLVVAAAITSAILWVRTWLQCRRAARPLLRSMLPVRPRELPFWSPADAMVMFGCNLMLLGIGQFLLSQRGWQDWVSARVAVTVVAGALSSGLVLAWLRMIHPHPLSGLSLIFNRGDARLGLRASVLLLPPVLLINALVSRLQPYQHEVLDMLQSVESFAVFALMFLATAIVTPFVEELLFRVLLQGGLQKLTDRTSGDPTAWRPESWMPIVLTSVVFAVMHLGQGAAPIPLFFLSLGLGFLYRQTGNITAPLVVHVVLNSLTMIVMFAESLPTWTSSVP